MKNPLRIAGAVAAGVAFAALSAAGVLGVLEAGGGDNTVGGAIGAGAGIALIGFGLVLLILYAD